MLRWFGFFEHGRRRGFVLAALMVLVALVFENLGSPPAFLRARRAGWRILYYALCIFGLIPGACFLARYYLWSQMDKAAAVQGLTLVGGLPTFRGASLGFVVGAVMFFFLLVREWRLAHPH